MIKTPGVKIILISAEMKLIKCKCHSVLEIDAKEDATKGQECLKL